MSKQNDPTHDPTAHDEGTPEKKGPHGGWGSVRGMLRAFRKEKASLDTIGALENLNKPGGVMCCSTINRNPKSYVFAIVGAEQVMRWLPRGTHDWRKFITPAELYRMLRRAGLEPVDRTGFVFDPLRWSWRLSDRDLSVNYVTTSLRPDG